MYIYTYVYMCVHVCLTSCGDPAGETYSSLDELRNQVPELGSNQTKKDHPEFLSV